MADVCIVSSLRDGFGLTGFEFVACQQQRVDCEASAKAPGVLILSEFAGSAQSMASAIHFNPWATGELVVAIERAVTMSVAERSLRHSQSYRYVCEHDTNAWSRSFIRATSAAAAERIERARVLGTEQGKPEKGRALPLPLLTDAYRAAGQRLLVLDLEGTLVRLSLSLSLSLFLSLSHSLSFSLARALSRFVSLSLSFSFYFYFSCRRVFCSPLCVSNGLPPPPPRHDRRCEQNNSGIRRSFHCTQRHRGRRRRKSQSQGSFARACDRSSRTRRTPW